MSDPWQSADPALRRLVAEIETAALGEKADGKDLYDRRSALCRWVAEDRERAVKEAVDAEPELDGEMPDEMWGLIRSDRDAATEALRATVRATKKGILDRGAPHA